MMMGPLYSRFLLPALLLLAGLAALFHPKVRATLMARRGVWRRLAAAAGRRDEAKPLVWFHAASAGEYLQAEPVIRRFLDSGAQVAVTVTSISGLPWAKGLSEEPGVVWVDVLPPDFPGAVRRLMSALRPGALVFVQADLWPGLIAEGRRRGIPMILIAARLGAHSLRCASPLVSWLYRPVYQSLSVILALGEADRARLARLAPGHEGLSVGGDPGIETALRRSGEAVPPRLPPGFDRASSKGHGPILVVGSTWPADEAVWVPVVAGLMANNAKLRLIVAPHEPSPSRMAELERALTEWGPIRLSRVEEKKLGNDARVVLVDSVGQLAALYKAGTVAYVGGGLTSGVHNVAEPAAAGLPVCFGPRHGNSATAAELLRDSAAFVVADEASLERALLPLLEPAGAKSAGAKARGVMTRLAGAADLAHERIHSALTGDSKRD